MHREYKRNVVHNLGFLLTSKSEQIFFESFEILCKVTLCKKSSTIPQAFSTKERLKKILLNVTSFWPLVLIKFIKNPNAELIGNFFSKFGSPDFFSNFAKMSCF